MDTIGASNAIHALSDYAWPITRSILILILIFVNYQFIRLVWYPLKTKRFYSKYQNIIISDEVDISKKILDSSKKDQQIDARFSKVWNQYFIELISLKSVKLFDTIRPHVLDRSSYMNEFSHKLIPQSIKIIETNDSFKHRKLIYSKILGSSFIPSHLDIIVQSITSTIDRCKMKEFIDFTEEMKQLVLKISMKVFYGYDFYQRVNIANYKTTQGYLDYIHFMDLFPRILDDLEKEETNLKTFLFPYPAKKWFIEPFSTNFYNVRELWRILNDFISNTDDENSTYKSILNSGEIDQNLIFSDFLGFIISSYITLPYAIWNTMLLVKKYPEVLAKVRNELVNSGVNFRDLKDKEDFKVKLDTWDYFNYVIKEWLRIHPPATTTMYYSTKDDIEFWDFTIKGGTKVSINISAIHNDPSQWIDSTEFFQKNSMSEYFWKLKKKLQEIILPTFHFVWNTRLY